MYDYRKAVKDDIRNYFDVNRDYIDFDFSDRDSLREKLHDNLWISDSVTGNGSGSYTFSIWQAEENLNHNLGLLEKACKEFDSHYDMKSPEAADVTIRCYLLSECLEEVLDEMEEKLSNTIVFDVETTGVNPENDELLQVSVINGLGKTLFDEYVKPEHVTQWKKAQAVNGISPEMVEEKKSIKTFVPELQKIFDGAEKLVSYNGSFDTAFLKAAGINIPDVPHLDVMKAFAPVYGEKTELSRSTDGYKWKKLTDAAEHFGLEIDAHNSLGDAEVTLEVAKKMYGNALERLTEEELEKYAIDSEEKRRNAETAYLVGCSNVKTLLESIKSGKHPAFNLPSRKDGTIKTRVPTVYSYASGKSYQGYNQLVMQALAVKLGYPKDRAGNVYVATEKQICSMNNVKDIDNFDSKFRKYEIALSIDSIDKKGKKTVFTLYPIQAAKDWAVVNPKAASTSSKLPAKNDNSCVVFDASSPDITPKEWLANYLAAAKGNATFKTTKEIAERIRNQLENELMPDVAVESYSRLDKYFEEVTKGSEEIFAKKIEELTKQFKERMEGLNHCPSIGSTTKEKYIEM